MHAQCSACPTWISFLVKTRCGHTILEACRIAAHQTPVHPCCAAWVGNCKLWLFTFQLSFRKTAQRRSKNSCALKNVLNPTAVSFVLLLLCITSMSFSSVLLGKKFCLSLSEKCQNINIDNGYFTVEKRTFRLWDKVSYSCHSGFVTPEGQETGVMQCQENGWTPPPMCIRE